MILSSLFTVAARFVGRVGNQAAVSVAASAAAAACFALPGLLAGHGEPDAAAPARTEMSAWESPVAPDGKIRDRHREAAGEEGTAPALRGHGLIMPASIAMPMTLEWSRGTAEFQAGAEPLPVAREAAPIHVAQRLPQPVPPRRPVFQAEKAPALQQVVAPLTIAPPVQTAAMVTASPDDEMAPRPPASILGRPLPKAVGYVGGAVSGAAGLIGAAGSWTVSLLPSF